MDTPDPKTGLTKRQKDAVKENWRKVAAGWKTHGPDFFIRLFKTYPSILAYFKTLNDMDFDTMKASNKLKAHTINFKMGINSYIDNLEEPECLVILIQKTTENHYKRGIRVESFQDAFKLFVSFLQEVDNIDDFTKDSWEKTLAVVASVVDARIKELDEQKVSGD